MTASFDCQELCRIVICPLHGYGPHHDTNRAGNRAQIYFFAPAQENNRNQKIPHTAADKVTVRAHKETKVATRGVEY